MLKLMLYAIVFIVVLLVLLLFAIPPEVLFGIPELKNVGPMPLLFAAGYSVLNLFMSIGMICGSVFTLAYTLPPISIAKAVMIRLVKEPKPYLKVVWGEYCGCVVAVIAMFCYVGKIR